MFICFHFRVPKGSSTFPGNASNTVIPGDRPRSPVRCWVVWAHGVPKVPKMVPYWCQIQDRWPLTVTSPSGSPLYNISWASKTYDVRCMGFSLNSLTQIGTVAGTVLAHWIYHSIHIYIYIYIYIHTCGSFKWYVLCAVRWYVLYG